MPKPNLGAMPTPDLVKLTRKLLPIPPNKLPSPHTIRHAVCTLYVLHVYICTYSKLPCSSKSHIKKRNKVHNSNTRVVILHQREESDDQALNADIGTKGLQTSVQLETSIQVAALVYVRPAIHVGL
jgi:hypothetical protein